MLASSIIGITCTPYCDAEIYSNFKDYNDDKTINYTDAEILSDDILNNAETETDVFDLMVMKKYLVSQQNAFKKHIEFNRYPKLKRVSYNGQIITFGDTDFRLNDEQAERLSAVLNRAGYSKSFALYDINTGGFIGHNLNVYYGTASTVKAPTVLSCLKAVEDGQHSLDEKMTFSYNYSSIAGHGGVIETTPYGSVFSLEKIMEYTITESDNVGYYMLQDHFGYSVYNDFLKSLDNKVTIDGSIRWGKTSAYDSMKNWIEIYNYINGDNENSELFQNMLENTTKSCIRDALGDKYKIANKMGWIYNQCCHDHAYVMSDSPYLMIILTNGDAYEGNEAFIRELAVVLDDIHMEYSKYCYFYNE